MPDTSTNMKALKGDALKRAQEIYAREILVVRDKPDFYKDVERSLQDVSVVTKDTAGNETKKSLKELAEENSSDPYNDETWSSKVLDEKKEYITSLLNKVEINCKKLEKMHTQTAGFLFSDRLFFAMAPELHFQLGAIMIDGERHVELSTLGNGEVQYHARGKIFLRDQATEEKISLGEVDYQFVSDGDSARLDYFKCSDPALFELFSEKDQSLSVYNDPGDERRRPVVLSPVAFLAQKKFLSELRQKREHDHDAQNFPALPRQLELNKDLSLRVIDIANDHRNVIASLNVENTETSKNATAFILEFLHRLNVISESKDSIDAEIAKSFIKKLKIAEKDGEKLILIVECVEKFPHSPVTEAFHQAYYHLYKEQEISLTDVRGSRDGNDTHRTQMQATELEGTQTRAVASDVEREQAQVALKSRLNQLAVEFYFTSATPAVNQSQFISAANKPGDIQFLSKAIDTFNSEVLSKQAVPTSFNGDVIRASATMFANGVSYQDFSSKPHDQEISPRTWLQNNLKTDVTTTDALIMGFNQQLVSADNLFLDRFTASFNSAISVAIQTKPRLALAPHVQCTPLSAEFSQVDGVPTLTINNEISYRKIGRDSKDDFFRIKTTYTYKLETRNDVANYFLSSATCEDPLMLSLLTGQCAGEKVADNITEILFQLSKNFVLRSTKTNQEKFTALKTVYDSLKELNRNLKFDLSGMDFSEVAFSEKDEHGSLKNDISMASSFQGAVLGGVKNVKYLLTENNNKSLLRDTNLSDVSFDYLKFKNADISGAQLSSACFRAGTTPRDTIGSLNADIPTNMQSKEPDFKGVLFDAKTPFTYAMRDSDNQSIVTLKITPEKLYRSFEKEYKKLLSTQDYLSRLLTSKKTSIGERLLLAMQFSESEGDAHATVKRAFHQAYYNECLIAARSKVNNFETTRQEKREIVLQLLQLAEFLDVRKDFQGMDLFSVDLSALDFTGARFDRANLEEVNFTGSILVGTRFSKAKITSHSLAGSIIHKTKFTDALLKKDIRTARVGEQKPTITFVIQDRDNAGVTATLTVNIKEFIGKIYNNLEKLNTGFFKFHHTFLKDLNEREDLNDSDKLILILDHASQRNALGQENLTAKIVRKTLDEMASQNNLIVSDNTEINKETLPVLIRWMEENKFSPSDNLLNKMVTKSVTIEFQGNRLEQMVRARELNKQLTPAAILASIFKKMISEIDSKQMRMHIYLIKEFYLTVFNLYPKHNEIGADDLTPFFCEIVLEANNQLNDAEKKLLNDHINNYYGSPNKKSPLFEADNVAQVSFLSTANVAAHMDDIVKASLVPSSKAVEDRANQDKKKATEIIANIGRVSWNQSLNEVNITRFLRYRDNPGSELKHELRLSQDVNAQTVMFFQGILQDTEGDLVGDRLKKFDAEIMKQRAYFQKSVPGTKPALKKERGSPQQKAPFPDETQELSTAQLKVVLDYVIKDRNSKIDKPKMQLVYGGIVSATYNKRQNAYVFNEPPANNAIAALPSLEIAEDQTALVSFSRKLQELKQRTEKTRMDFVLHDGGRNHFTFLGVLFDPKENSILVIHFDSKFLNETEQNASNLYKAMKTLIESQIKKVFSQGNNHKYHYDSTDQQPKTACICGDCVMQALARFYGDSSDLKVKALLDANVKNKGEMRNAMSALYSAAAPVVVATEPVVPAIEPAPTPIPIPIPAVIAEPSTPVSPSAPTNIATVTQSNIPVSIPAIPATLDSTKIFIDRFKTCFETGVKAITQIEFPNKKPGDNDAVKLNFAFQSLVVDDAAKKFTVRFNVTDPKTNASEEVMLVATVADENKITWDLTTKKNNSLVPEDDTNRYYVLAHVSKIVREKLYPTNDDTLNPRKIAPDQIEVSAIDADGNTLNDNVQHSMIAAHLQAKYVDVKCGSDTYTANNLERLLLQLRPSQSGMFSSPTNNPLPNSSTIDYQQKKS